MFSTMPLTPSLPIFLTLQSKSPMIPSMWKQHKVPPVFSMAVGRPAVPPGSAPEGYLALGGLVPVATVGPWARADIEISPLGPGYINGSLPCPQIRTWSIPLSQSSYMYRWSALSSMAKYTDAVIIEWYAITPDAFLYITTPAGQPPVWKPLNTGPPGTPRFQTLIDSGVMHTWLPAPIAEHAASLFVPPAICTFLSLLSLHPHPPFLFLPTSHKISTTSRSIQSNLPKTHFS